MKYLGVDYGDRRTGLAISDALGMLASTAGTVVGSDMVKVAAEVAEKAKELGAGAIVLGYPKNMNNTEGPRAEKTMLFKGELEKVFSGEVILRDERATTVSATRMLNDTNTRGKKRKAVIDSVAATVILQDYLDFIRR